MTLSKYWTTTIQCAHCKMEQETEQPGAQPPGWVVLAYTERKFNLQQPKAPPQIVYVPYPLCGPVCAALFSMTRAWGSLHTKDEQMLFKASLRTIKWVKENDLEAFVVTD